MFLRGGVDGCSVYVKYKHLLETSSDRLLPSDFATSVNFTVCRLRRSEEAVRMIAVAQLELTLVSVPT